MTSWVVCDSNIFLAVSLQEPFSEQADALIEAWRTTGVQIAVPYLFRYEVTSVLRKHIARGNITLEQGQAGLLALLREPLQVVADDPLLQRAFALANRLNRPAAYDSMYLALAERLQCEFWTADMKFYNASNHTFNWVKWVGHFTPPA